MRRGRIVVNCDPSLPSSLGCQTCKWSLSQSSQSSPSSQDRYSCTITQLATHTNHTTQATQLNLHEPTYMVCPLLGFHTSFFTVENREVCSRNEMFHSSNFWQNLDICLAIFGDNTRSFTFAWGQSWESAKMVHPILSVDAILAK